MGASFYQHQVNPLDVEDSWSLLKKQLPPDQVSLFRLYLVSYMLVLLVLHAPASKQQETSLSMPLKILAILFSLPLKVLLPLPA
jgi:hypothetical protein